MRNFEPYIKYLTGIEVMSEDVNDLDYGKLQNYFKQEYEFKKADLFGKEMIFALRKYDDHFTTEQYLKHVEIFSNFFNATIVLVLDKLESYNRIRMIHKKVPFIVPFKQMYIPQMFVNINEMKSTGQKHSDIFSPAAQCILLYHLQISSIENYILKDIVTQLNNAYTKMTISRVANELKEKDICSIEGTKEKKLVFNYQGLELWNKVEEHVTTPVKSRVFVDDDLINMHKIKAGISALSEYGKVRDDQATCYAIYQKSYKLFLDSKIITFNKHEGDFPIEVWKYDPGLLSNKGIVDKLSLYLSLKDNDDTRVEMDVEELIRNMKW